MLKVSKFAMASVLVKVHHTPNQAIRLITALQTDIETLPLRRTSDVDFSTRSLDREKEKWPEEGEVKTICCHGALLCDRITQLLFHSDLLLG